MARLVGSIPNFINGISQQPDQIRMPSQAERQVNAFSTVAKGLIKRPPTESVAKISSSQSDDAFVHIINRGVNERFIVVYDTAHVDTTPQKLTATESQMTLGAAEWVATSMTSAVSTAHSTTWPSYDGKTNYLSLDGNNTDIAFLYPDFTPAATTWYTFSIWMRRRSGEATVSLILQGADFAAPATSNVETTTNWVKYSVTAQTVGSPTGAGTSAFECKILFNGTSV